MEENKKTEWTTERVVELIKEQDELIAKQSNLIDYLLDRLEKAINLANSYAGYAKQFLELYKSALERAEEKDE